MAGNMLMWLGPEAYNTYSHALITNPLLPVAEIGLVVFFVAHLGLALSLVWQNKAAKGGRYAVSGDVKAGGFAAKTMVYTGLLLLVFIVLHLITFKYGPHYTATYHGVEMRDLHRLIVEKFSEPLYVAWYWLSLIVLGIHLSHGFAGTFQSLGIASSNHPTIRKIGWAFAIIVSAGFISQPLYVICCGGR